MYQTCTCFRKARQIHIVGIVEAGEFEDIMAWETKQSIVWGTFFLCFSILQDEVSKKNQRIQTFEQSNQGYRSKFVLKSSKMIQIPHYNTRPGTANSCEESSTHTHNWYTQSGHLLFYNLDVEHKDKKK